MTATKNKIFTPASLAFFIATVCATAHAQDYFNPELLEIDNPGAGKTDLSLFEAGSQAPGSYRVDVVLNDQLVDTRDIEFTPANNADNEMTLTPCLSVEQLKAWGVRTELFPALGEPSACANIAAIPQASTEFQFSTQRLLISMPQAAVAMPARGYVPPEQWDDGINAAMLNYSLSGASSWARTGNSNDSHSQYVNLRPGINVGPWRLRNYTTWLRDNDGKNKWDTVYTYAQRGVVPLKAQLTAGDSSAPSDVFDSMPFRGLQLASDDDMLPDSLRGYAPVVRGIARTNAQIVIRQNGYVIYQSYVAPGAFEITDMYPTGGAGDLNVTVKEADGSEQHFVVPFASLPVLQREGHLKFAVTGGQYRSYDSSIDKTPFAQATAIYGLPAGFTLYGGVQESSKYQSLAAGVGKNLGDFGAISLDAIQAWSSPKGQEKSDGQSWRARYSKNIVNTGTNFAIAGYRYSTSGYYGMQEILDTYSDSAVLQERRRNRTELSMSQNLWHNAGSLMLSAVREDYWNSGRTMESYSAGYNNSWGGIYYGLTYTYSKNGTSTGRGHQTYYDKDQQLALNVSIPLDKFLPNSWASYSLNTSKNNGTVHQVGMNGMALTNNALNWNVQQGYSTQGVGYTGNMNADYKGTYGEVTTGYAYDKNSSRLNYGLQGGMVAHADGLTLSQPLGETNVLIKAPGAKGVGIQNQTGAKTDFRGYTAVSNVTPFRKNDVSLLTETLPDDVELELTSATATPTRGAIVRANYAANVGYRVLMTLKQTSGQPIPFGAMVKLVGNEDKAFIVGDGGQVYLSGLSPKAELNVVWGKNSQSECKATVALNPAESQSGVVLSQTVCR